MSEKFFWNWLNIGRDGQPIDGEFGGGQRTVRSSSSTRPNQPLGIVRSLASVLWLVLMLAISPLVVGRVLLDKLLRACVIPMVRLDRFINGE
jgi:hypothetical protein